MDYKVTPRSVRRKHAEQMEFLVSSGDCLPLRREALSCILTAYVPSNSEYQRMKPCVHLTIEFES